MKEVIIPVGPQGSGKSFFCEKAVKADPNLVLISRDKILIELFGGVFLSPYSGEHFHAYDMMWRKVREQIRNTPEYRVILDTWNGTRQERATIIQKLRKLGAKRIVGWYFVTPVEAVNEWFWKKPEVAKSSDMRSRQGQNLTFFSDDAPIRDHALFHRLASEIDSEGFDEIVRINPVVIVP